MLGSFCKTPLAVNGGQRWSITVNRRQPNLHPRTPPFDMHRIAPNATSRRPPARLGSFRKMPAVVNGGQRWSMAVN
jgi:hypothetical protein